MSGKKKRARAEPARPKPAEPEARAEPARPEGRRDQLIRLYKVESGSKPKNLQTFLIDVGSGPIAGHACSSVDINMFRCSVQARAIEAGLNCEDPAILRAIEARIAVTPRTNYSGD